MTKSEIEICWKDGIREAVLEADRAVRDLGDDGTCNFDECLIKKEGAFTYDDTVRIFAEMGVKVSRHSRGWLCVSEVHGQAARNTAWHRKLAEVLSLNGFTTSMNYIMD